MARTRFRNLIRSVAFNRIWLVDTGDTKGISLNVKKNISMLVRTQRKIGMLTLAVSLSYFLPFLYLLWIYDSFIRFQDKGLIRMHPSMRTVEERKKLVTLLANLTCFSKIPPVIYPYQLQLPHLQIYESISLQKVRARLTNSVKFIVINAGRVIIKEGHIPDTVYFILTGEIEVTRKVFDHVGISQDFQTPSIHFSFSMIILFSKIL